MKKKKMGRPPVLTDAQKQAVRKEIMRIIGNLVISLTGASATRKKVKKKVAKKVAKKKVVKKKAKKRKAKKAKKRGRKKRAPSAKRVCSKCKKTVTVHPRQQNCTRCGAEKSLRKKK